MLKWFLRALALVFFGSIAVSIYDYIRGGYYNLPEFNDTSYVIAFKSGFRAIVVDPVVTNPSSHQGPFRYLQSLSRANPDRRYIGIEMVVPKWFKDAWSICNAPEDEEKRWIEETMPVERKSELVGARLDAVCYIEADEIRLPRGLIYSVPRL